jgi:periplasmic protein TonB
MNRNEIKKDDYLEVIFQDRNKSYGAYELRNNYETRAKKAVQGMLATILVLSIGLRVFSKSSEKIAETLKPDIIVTPVNITPEVKPEDPKPKEQEKLASTVKPLDAAITPEMVDDKTVVEPKDTAATPSDVIIDPNAIAGPIDFAGTGGTQVATDSSQILPSGDGPGNGVTTKPIVEPAPKQEPLPEIANIGTVEVEPEFPGGMDALVAFVSKNLVYPEKAIDNGYNCNVSVDFVVDEEGKIAQISSGKARFGCDAEAKRVVGLMPKWRPAKVHGKPIKCYFTIPINFTIEDAE